MLTIAEPAAHISSADSTQSTTIEKRTIRMYTTNWCPDCFRAKKVMEAMKVSFDEVDITSDEEAVETVLRLNNGFRSVPTIVFPDGSVLTEPPAHLLVQKLKSLT